MSPGAEAEGRLASFSEAPASAASARSFVRAVFDANVAAAAVVFRGEAWACLVKSPSLRA
jgi:hypothetical protein